MLVDNPISQFGLDEFINADYLTPSSSSSQLPPTNNTASSTTPSTNSTSPPSSSSRASSPSSPYGLMTPPQDAPMTTFPEVHESDPSMYMMGIFDDLSSKSAPSSSSSLSNGAQYDFFNNMYGDMGMPLMADPYAGLNMNMNLDPSIFSSAGLNVNGMDFNTLMPMMAEPIVGIDPQLVGTPAPEQEKEQQVEGEKEKEVEKEQEKEKEKLTLTIAPVKVGGHGKNRRGTVQSGGVVKKSAPPAPAKELSPAPVVYKAPTPPTPVSAPPAPAAKKPAQKAKKASTPATPGPDDDEDDDHELPQDWRPPPEVFAKMTSKEKRQLRNKISARNFRVRRKEYITTLEGDIAERDRLLDAIRTELGSTKDENRALRQEIEALKRTLLDGRGAGINLPPPAPLPDTSAAASLAASSPTPAQSSSILTPNTQKDLPTSPRLRGTGAFWGGSLGGFGPTPVHATFLPEVALGRKENINPALNAPSLHSSALNNSSLLKEREREREKESVSAAVKHLSGFDGFADLNPFTMKTLDAYRMHLWGRMAQQQQAHAHSQHNQQHAQQQQQQMQSGFHPTGLASSLKPMYFSSSSSSSTSSASPKLPSGYGCTLSALLSGKHASSSYPSPPSSPNLSSKLPSSLSSSSSPSSSQREREREKEHQAAMLAAMASQTLIKKLGNAFWDAFSGSSSSSSLSPSSAPSVGIKREWDAEKVRRVLEGKAVVRVVDVDVTPSPSTPPTPAARVPQTMRAGSGVAGQGQGEKGEKKCPSLCDMFDGLKINKK